MAGQGMLGIEEEVRGRVAPFDLVHFRVHSGFLNQKPPMGLQKSKCIRASATVRSK